MIWRGAAVGFAQQAGSVAPQPPKPFRTDAQRNHRGGGRGRRHIARQIFPALRERHIQSTRAKPRADSAAWFRRFLTSATPTLCGDPAWLLFVMVGLVRRKLVDRGEAAQADMQLAGAVVFA